MKVTTIIWDNIGVFTPSYHKFTLKKVAECFGISYENLLKVWDPLSNKVDEGSITSEEFHKQVLLALNSSVSVQELMKAHLGTYVQDNNIREFAKELKQEYNSILLTNFSDAYNECNKVWKMEEIFGDKIVVSYKIKMRKPHKDIFEYTLKKFNLIPEETIFIDDNPHNIKTALELGIKAIHFESLEKLKEDLKKYVKIEAHV